MKITKALKLTKWRAYLVFALYDHTASRPSGQPVIKAGIIGPKDEVTGVLAHLANNHAATISTYTDGKWLSFCRTYGTCSIRKIKLDGATYLGTIADKELVARVAYGDTRDELLEVAYDHFQKSSGIPLLREWMPHLWEMAIGSDAKCSVIGAEGEAYLLPRISPNNIEKAILENPRVFLGSAQTRLNLESMGV